MPQEQEQLRARQVTAPQINKLEELWKVSHNVIVFEHCLNNQFGCCFEFIWILIIWIGLFGS